MIPLPFYVQNAPPLSVVAEELTQSLVEENNGYYGLLIRLWFLMGRV